MTIHPWISGTTEGGADSEALSSGSVQWPPTLEWCSSSRTHFRLLRGANYFACRTQEVAHHSPQQVFGECLGNLTSTFKASDCEDL